MKKAATSKSVVNYQQTRQGRRPIRVHNLVKKASEDPVIQNDPLIVYLKKTAAEESAKGLVDKDGLMDDNYSPNPGGTSHEFSMPDNWRHYGSQDELATNLDVHQTASFPAPNARRDVEPTNEVVTKGDPISELKELFDESGAARKKYTDKDQSLKVPGQPS